MPANENIWSRQVWLLNSIGTSRKFRSPLSAAFTDLPFDLLSTPPSQCDSSPGESNPKREREYRFFICTWCPFSLPSFPLIPSFFISFLFVLIRLMTVLLSRKSLPRERFATEGCSYRCPGAFRPFCPPLSTSHSEQARNRRVTHESVIGKLTWLSAIILEYILYTALPSLWENEVAEFYFSSVNRSRYSDWNARILIGANKCQFFSFFIRGKNAVNESVISIIKRWKNSYKQYISFVNILYYILS